MLLILQKAEGQKGMMKLKINKQCAGILFHYFNELREIELWHEQNCRRQGATDPEAQYAGRVRLLNFLINEVLDNLDEDYAYEQT